MNQPQKTARKFLKPVTSLCIGFGAAALAVGLWETGILDRWENATWGWRVQLFAKPSEATPRVKVILLDQASLDWAKEQNGWSWPWPREAYTPIIDFCSRGGARTVAFDVLYTEPSVYGVGDDSTLAASIAAAPAFAGSVMLYKQGGLTAAWPVESRFHGYEIQGLQAWLEKSGPQAPVLPSASFPIPDLVKAMPYLGSVAGYTEGDIIVRSPTFAVFDGKILPSLWLASYCAGLEKAGRPVRMHVSQSMLTVNDVHIPIDKNGRSILRYIGSWDAHRPLSAAAVIQSELRFREGGKPSIDPSSLKDCYVFFGFSAPGLKDLRPTPICHDNNPGVEIHATAMDNLLSGRFLRDVPFSRVILFTLFLSLAGSFLVIYSRKTLHIAAASAAAVLVGAGAGFIAYRQGYALLMLAPIIGTAAAVVAAAMYNYSAEGRQKAFIKQAFRHYLGAEVIERLISDPSRLRLGGEKRELALFFSDIEKFSSFSERLDPPSLTALLNDFLTDMTGIILSEGGYLDKYIGDAIVAFWNAPVDQPDCAARACRAAIRCQRKLAERRQEFWSRFGATVKMRVGINVGDVVVGNMGSRERFNYTVLGDAANLASRLEGANKAFGTYVMVSGSTWDKALGQFIGREIGRLRVVGRKSAVQVYELTGFAGEKEPDCFSGFSRGLALFYAGKIAEARKIFETITDDPVSKSYVERCAKMNSVAPDGWDGVLNLTEK